MINNKWLETRRYNLTATSIPILFGFNKFKTIEELKQEKIHGEQRAKVQDSIHIRRGKIMEGAVLTALEYDFGIQATQFSEELCRRLYANEPSLQGFTSSGSLNKYEAYFQMKDHKLGATPDAIVVGDIKTLVECKAPQNSNKKYWAESPPIEYIAQVHTQMTVVPFASRAILGALFASKELDLLAWEIRKDIRISNIITEEVDRFWEEREEFEIDPMKSCELFSMMKESISCLSRSTLRLEE